MRLFVHKTFAQYCTVDIYSTCDLEKVGKKGISLCLYFKYLFSHFWRSLLFGLTLLSDLSDNQTSAVC